MGKKLCNIPRGWNIAKVEDIFYVLRGVTFPKSAKSEKADSYIGCLRTANVQQKVDWNDLWKIPEAYLTDEDKIVKEHDILISVANSLNLLGKSSYVSKVHQRSTFGTFIVNLRAKVDNPLLLYYFLQTRFFLDQVKDCASTTTNISNISTAKLKKLSVIVPPLPEQERIVAKIEELFSQLDAAVAELKSVKEKLAIYRQAVYSSVFNSLNDLRYLDNFFDITGGLTKNSRRQTLPNKRAYLRVANVYFNRLDLDEIKEIGVTDAEIDKCTLLKGDLLFVEGNGSKSQIGRVAQWDGSIAGCLHQNHLIKARSQGDIDSQYALFYFMSASGRKQILDVAASTSGLYTLSVNKIKRLQIPYCSRDKQQEVLQEIESRLSVCNNIEQTVDTALQQAAALRQSILKQAFEGKL